MRPESCSPPAERPRGFFAQFGKPTGTLGAVVGQLMALKNGPRSRFVLSLLDLAPHHRALEIGFGPGVDLARVAALVPEGSVAGVDHSDVMLRQARRRLKRTGHLARADLRLAGVAPLPFADAVFERLFSINCVQSWDNLDAATREISRVLAPTGRVAIAFQPMSRGATDDSARRKAAEIAESLGRAGLREISISERALRPVLCCCVLATR